jgi:hypothetical protein
VTGSEREYREEVRSVLGAGPSGTRNR